MKRTICVGLLAVCVMMVAGCTTSQFNVTDVTPVPAGATVTFLATNGPSAILGIQLDFGEIELPGIVQEYMPVGWSLGDGQWYLMRGMSITDSPITNLTMQVKR